MNNASQRQYEKAVEALKAADENLEHALQRQTGSENGADLWARVRALQAHAQLHILHTISHDLSDIRGAIEST